MVRPAFSDGVFSAVHFVLGFIASRARGDFSAVVVASFAAYELLKHGEQPHTLGINVAEFGAGYAAGILTRVQ